MIIGNNTRRCLNRDQINIKAISSNKPKYNTRLQRKLQQQGTINISNSASKENINKLLKNMTNFMPGVKYFKSKSICNGIKFNCNEHGFKLQGKNIDLYTLLSNSLGINLLVAIWNDQITPSYQLTSQEYVNNFKEINIDVEGRDCAICLDHIDKKMVRTHCNHYFHSNCIKQWLTKDCYKPNCPNCRSSLDVY